MTIAASFPTIKPSLSLDFANVGALDPRVTFARSTTATYYDGVTTAKAEENLLSNTDLSSASWSTAGSVTKVGSTTDPAGGSTGVELNFTGSGFLFRPNTFPATQITVSVYAKEGTTNTLRFRIYNNTSTATYISTTFTLTADWERYDFTFTNGVAASCNFQLDVGGTNTGTVYFAFPQAEARSQVTAYTPTTTQPITNYIPVLQTAAAGVPRFDHNPTTGEALGLLIEEQRTNLTTYSEQFDNAAWTKVGTTITANTIVAPDGTLNGDKLVEDTSTGLHYMPRNVTLTAVGYTYTIFAKAAERQFLRLNYNSTVYAAASFNLLSGTLTAGSGTGFLGASITSVGNGWYRCSISFTGIASLLQVGVILENPSSVASYTGDGYSGIYIWGAQLEVGSFPTSYIPTVASQVTRNADAASMTGTNFSSWVNNGEGTLYAEFARVTTSNTARVFQFDDGTAANRAYVGGDSVAGLIVAAGGSTQASITSGSITAGVFCKVAGAYKVNDFAVSGNGSTVGVDPSGIIPVATRALIGVNEGATTYLNGTIKKISYYPQRLTNANLQALTA